MASRPVGGGINGKKFKYKSSSEPVEKQRSILYERFEQWRHNPEQIDDVCVAGIRI